MVEKYKFLSADKEVKNLELAKKIREKKERINLETFSFRNESLEIIGSNHYGPITPNIRISVSDGLKLLMGVSSSTQ